MAASTANGSPIDLRPVQVLCARQLHTTDQPGLEPGVPRLSYFKFIGRVLGLTVFHHRFLNAYFVGFYKMVLNKR